MMHYQVADIAIRLRIAALGEGSYEVRLGDPVGRITEAVLPGGTRVTVATDGAERSLGQMFDRRGAEMSTRLDLSEPETLASLLHNIDCEIMRAGPHDRFTVCDLAAIDALALLSEGALADTVGSLLPSICDALADPRPTARHLAILGAMASGDDPHIAGTASEALSAHLLGAPQFKTDVSRVRCSAIAEALHSNNGDAVAQFVEVGRRDGSWKRLFTRAGLNAMQGRIAENAPTAWPELWPMDYDAAMRIRNVAADAMRREPESLVYVFSGREGPELVAVADDARVRAERGDRDPLSDRDVARLSVLAEAIGYEATPAPLPAPR